MVEQPGVQSPAPPKQRRKKRKERRKEDVDSDIESVSTLTLYFSDFVPVRNVYILYKSLNLSLKEFAGETKE